MEEAASRIRVLPSALADQIAAGEVVERPASVVKELCENAIDAGARKVEIEIEAGGRRLIRVIDDGCGMTATEARLALLRHATSKISAPDDLWGLETFGFRGEALPSIAAVSRLTIKTRPPEAMAGFQVCVEAGQQTDAGETGMPVGTHLEVRDLFFNTPARLKFLKNEATEMGNVSEAVLRLALANPGVHLRLRTSGRTVLDLAPQAELAERVRAALARRGASALHEARGEEAGCRVRAFLASPGEAASSARSTFLFVGRRFVRDRSLLHALSMGYGELLDKGRYPLAALFIEVPGRELDVNVHPQKLEVRFARAQEVYGAVRHVVAAALAGAPWLTAPVPGPTVRSWSPPPRIGREPPGAAPPRLAFADRASDGPAAAWRADGAQGEVARQQPAPHTPAPEPESPGAFFARLSYVGQLHRTYLVCEAPDELVLIDQHAAHERVAFERIRAAHARRGIARQQLLFPIPIEVDELAAAAAGDPDAIELLGTLGFELEAFGPATVLVRAVPDLLREVDPKPLVLDVLHRFVDGAAGQLAQERLAHLFATMACHSVVRAGDVLGHEQAVALLAQLDAVDLRSHCPHGRPVLVRMPLSDLEHRFGRT